MQLAELIFTSTNASVVGRLHCRFFSYKLQKQIPSNMISKQAFDVTQSGCLEWKGKKICSNTLLERTYMLRDCISILLHQMDFPNRRRHIYGHQK